MSTAFSTADILLPKNADMTRWAVVACDQFTSQKEYWEKAASVAGDAPSALDLILPEAYLGAEDEGERIVKIHKKMDEYLSEGLFEEYKDCFIYVRRTDSTGKMREGIVGKIDLEMYDYNKGSTSQVRATEATVAERIPPRLAVRRGAPLELPHIMILIDDPGKTVIEPLAGEELPVVYDFDLMLSGGHIEGRLVRGESARRIEAALDTLGERENFERRSCVSGVPVLHYAMGDGNHSLATAKAYYEELKAAHPGEDLSDHPARYALVEIVNLHSDALEFEAIHRVIEGIDPSDFLIEMTDAIGLTDNNCPQYFEMVFGGEAYRAGITKPSSNLTVGSVQDFIDDYVRRKGGTVDYIHGVDVVRKLAEKPDTVGIILPYMGKDELFPSVIKDGALPRKTFSMGHAEDKRYYVEARRISAE
ncbi:MAG: DUF1015 domain-containing protein [Oscillospiraceae bacterium]|nr:DUF1015 domain-containing protein [Oscillospiraceae bacterium]